MPTAGNQRAGTTLTLEIEVILLRIPLPDGLREAINNQLQLDIGSPFLTLRNYARVYFAPAPLPRFDNRWLYGDLHYHSQGTDNEGEAAYNYRNVVRAMGAMGLDFVFATEHASSSGQWIDVDLNLDLLKEGIGNWLSGDVDPIEEDDAPKLGGVLRDMDARRYAFNHEKIYGTKGVNREASLQGAPGRLPQSYLSHKVVPQIFLGGELDDHSRSKSVHAGTAAAAGARTLSTRRHQRRIPGMAKEKAGI